MGSVVHNRQRLAIGLDPQMHGPAVASIAVGRTAGVYALAAQVKPSITPDEFWSVAMKTGRTIELQHGGRTLPFGPIVDPGALIRALE